MPAACASASSPRIRPTNPPGERGQRLGEILDALEAFYGEQSGHSPADPYRFLIWWHCGYPPSEERCRRGWAALEAAVGVSPQQLLCARGASVARALRAGGMVPEIRAERVREIARRVRDELGGDLRSALERLPSADAHRMLRSFSGIGAPGADRILLFAGLSPAAAVPSNCPHVLTRIESGSEPASYAAAYRAAQQVLATLRPAFGPRRRAYLLVKAHGQELCKRQRPRCAECPIAERCAFAARRARKRRA